MIEMELDHDSGKMRGMVLAGPDEGRTLDSMTRPQCEALYDLCCQDDPEGARLVEAYLDRRFAGWRAATQNQGNSGRRGTNRRPGRCPKMRRIEVLGLQKGASEEDVVRSHRSLDEEIASRSRGVYGFGGASQRSQGCTDAASLKGSKQSRPSLARRQCQFFVAKQENPERLRLLQARSALSASRPLKRAR